nr:immunoglobulin heavy chain junction region [Mus musculus]
CARIGLLRSYWYFDVW